MKGHANPQSACVAAGGLAGTRTQETRGAKRRPPESCSSHREGAVLVEIGVGKGARKATTHRVPTEAGRLVSLVRWPSRPGRPQGSAHPDCCGAGRDAVACPDGKHPLFLRPLGGACFTCARRTCSAGPPSPDRWPDIHRPPRRPASPATGDRRPTGAPGPWRPPRSNGHRG